MTLFDLIVLALVAASVVAGALRGLINALITFFALVLGLLLAARGYAIAGSILRGLDIIESSAGANAVGFILIAFIALAAGFVAGRLISKRLKRARLAWLDRTLGAGFGLLRGLALCSILYLALTAFPVRLSAITEATSAPVLAEGARLLTAFTSSDLRTRFLKGYSESTNRK